MSGNTATLLPFNILNNKNPFQQESMAEPHSVPLKRKHLPPIPAFTEEASCKEVITKKLKISDNFQNNTEEAKKAAGVRKGSNIEVEDITEYYLKNKKFQNILKKVSYNKEKNEFELVITNDYIHPFTKQLEKFKSGKLSSFEFDGKSQKTMEIEESKIQSEVQKPSEKDSNKPENSIIKRPLLNSTNLEKIKNIHKILGYRLLRDLFREKTKWAYQKDFLNQMEEFLQKQKVDVNEFRNWVDQNWLTFRYKDGHEEKKCILQSRRDFVFLIEYSEKKEKLLKSLRNSLRPEQNNNILRDIIFGEKLRKLAYLWLKKYSSFFLTEKSNRLSEGELYLEKVPDILRLFQEYKLKRESNTI